MKNYKQQRRRTEWNYATALALEMTLPPEARNWRKIEKLRRKVRGL